MKQNHINEALDIKTIQAALNNIKKFIPNLDITTLIKNANKNPVVPSQAPQLPEGQQKPVVV